MKLLCPPLFDALQSLYLEAHAEFLIMSPWIKYDALQDVIDQNQIIQLRVLTVGNLEHFLIRASDLEAIEWLLQMGADIRLVSNLHAKVYMADRSQAIITSANFTHSGLQHNLELGVSVNEEEHLKYLYQIIDDWFFRGRQVGKDWLEDMQNLIASHQVSTQRLQQANRKLHNAGKKLRGNRIVSTQPVIESRSYSGGWVKQIKEWKMLKSSPKLAEEVVRFFQLAFARLPERTLKQAWFGVHSKYISLTVGNIWLASLSYKNKKIWLLVDDKWHETAPSTERYIPLGWWTCPLENLADLNQDPNIWESYAQAAEKIWESPISKLRIPKNLRNKQKVSILLGIGESSEEQ